MVVDYAETCPGQVAALLDAAARHNGTSPFKLLLAHTAGDWWQALQASSSVAEDLLDGADDLALPALEPDREVSRSSEGVDRGLPRVGVEVAALGLVGHESATSRRRASHVEGVLDVGPSPQAVFHTGSLRRTADSRRIPQRVMQVG
ncbi:hypothetical protein ACTWQR_38900 [Streptomyces sp. 2A115]